MTLPNKRLELAGAAKYRRVALVPESSLVSQTNRRLGGRHRARSSGAIRWAGSTRRASGWMRGLRLPSATKENLR